MIYIRREINKKGLAILCRQLAFMLNSRISISKAIDILSNHYENKKTREILKSIHKNILTGKSFSQSLLDCNGCFPRLMIAMSKAGENSGSLDIVMSKLASHYETEEKFISSMKQAMIYPCFVCIMMIGVLVLAITFVIPGYAEIFSGSGVELPILTSVIISISHFISNNFLIIISVFMVLCVLLKIFANTNNGKYFFGRLVFYLPVYGLRINFVFAQILYILLSSGINIIFAVDSIKETLNNEFLDKKFDIIIQKLKNGHRITQSIEESFLFNSILISMLNVGESSGNLTDVMSHCEKYFSVELERKLNSFQKLIEPILTIIVGIILGIIMIAIMEPTFSMGDIL